MIVSRTVISRYFLLKMFVASWFFTVQKHIPAILKKGFFSGSVLLNHLKSLIGTLTSFVTQEKTEHRRAFAQAR